MIENTRRLQIPSRDGTPLEATFFPGGESGTVVLVNSAMGVPARFYRRFAEGLAGAGPSGASPSVVTWDYRGVAASAPESLKGYRATPVDWATLDLPAMIDWLHAEHRPRRLVLVGHSVGGQMAGLIDNPGRVDGMVTLSAQSGYWRLQGGEQKLVVLLHAYVTLPLMARLFGYAPWSRFGMGVDLPKGVVLRWAEWLRDPRYLLGDDRLPLDRFGDFRAPVLAYSFADDKWGTPRAVDAMMAAYPEVERRHVDPADVGLSTIGHMGFFRPESGALWREVGDWIRALPARPAPKGDSLEGTSGLE